MLTGSADIDTLASTAPQLAAFSNEDLDLGDVLCLQLTAEMRNSAREAVLPPSLHPTIPAALSLQALRVQTSPWGAFDLALCRVSCRSGVRARGFSTGGYVSSEAACAGLRERLGFPLTVGEVDFRHGYDGVSLKVDSAVHVEALDPEPMGLDAVQYTGTLNLAHTPMGLRLLQVEMQTSASQVERLRPRILSFDGAAWGNALLAPSQVIAATVSTMHLVLPVVRFVCKADELAFTGTEAVS